MLVKLVKVKFGFRIVKKCYYYYLCERLRKGQKNSATITCGGDFHQFLMTLTIITIIYSTLQLQS